MTAPVLAQAPPAAPRTADQEAAARQVAENNKLPDPSGTGRFAAMKEEVAALPKHVVYRPADLAALGDQKLGVVAWGNGGCSNDGASSRFHLLELASHGYLVIASGRILSGPGAAAAEPRAPAQPGQPPPAANAACGSHGRDRLGARRKPARAAARTSGASIQRKSRYRAGAAAACKPCASRTIRA